MPFAAILEKRFRDTLGPMEHHREARRLGDCTSSRPKVDATTEYVMVKLMAGAAEAIKAPKVPEMKPLPVRPRRPHNAGA